jgi:glutamine amidotransferase-like uncharacterized protein
LLGLLLLSVSSLAAAAPLALVYNGEGACKEDCARLAAKAVQRAGFRVEFVNRHNLGKKSFRHAALWVQPGGKSDEVAEALSQRQKNLIREFIGSGGRYLGFCAGAFLIDRYVHGDPSVPGLNLWPGNQVLAGPDDDFGHVVPVRCMGKTNWLYYAGGVYFFFYPNDPAMAAYSAVAFYANGAPAALEFQFHRGRVAVIGLHPEASPEWKEKIPDPDGDDFPVVRSMLEFLFAK